MYNYPYYNTSNVAVDDGTWMGILIGYSILGIVLYCVQAFFASRLFKKAGLPAWQAWVPILAQWKFLELGGQKGWLVLLILASVIPFVGWIGAVVTYVFMCIAAYNIGLKLKKSGGFTALYIFFSIIWLGICGLDKSKWDESKGAKSLVKK